MSDKTFTIGALARLTRTNPAMIRQYEELGLLPPPARPGRSQLSSAGGARVYDIADVRRLIFLRRCRDLGILNPRLQVLVELIDNPNDASQDARDLAASILGNVREQVKEFSELAETLGALLTGTGSEALAITGVDTAPIDAVKRMRRQIRKPLKTPTAD